MDGTQKNGEILVLSGFSGVGKDSVKDRLILMDSSYCFSVSATTRSPRKNEVDGKDYHFLTRDEFGQWEKEGRFIEAAEYCGNLYGTPVSGIMGHIGDGKDVILILEPSGALKVKAMFRNAVLVYIMPPSMEELDRRVSARKSETCEELRLRHERNRQDARMVGEYDYVVVNRDAHRCALRIHNIIQSEKCKAAKCLGFVEELMKE